MKRTENKYVKRTQKDYPMSFKLSVVREYEETKAGLRELTRKYGIQGHDTIRKWINKFGTFDWQNLTLQPMAKTKDQELLELREKVKVLERKNARLEKELEQKDMKAEFFDLMIEIAEEEYGVDIRKKCSPEQSDDTGR
jgi:transposase-like protein